ncbi:MAG: tetratricopeptide repeat protein [Gemmatimonadota bacterium]
MEIEPAALEAEGSCIAEQPTPEGLEAAVDDLEQAVALDPEFGRAHGMLGMLCGFLRDTGLRTAAEAFPLVRREAELAMRFAPDEPESRMAMMVVHMALERDREAARRDLEAVLALDPSYMEGRWALAQWCGYLAGDTKRGLREIEAARRLDPLGARLELSRGWILINGRRFDDAAEVLVRLYRANPDHVDAAILLAEAWVRAGRYRGSDRPARGSRAAPGGAVTDRPGRRLRAGREVGPRARLSGAGADLCGWRARGEPGTDRSGVSVLLAIRDSQ